MSPEAPTSPNPSPTPPLPATTDRWATARLLLAPLALVYGLVARARVRRWRGRQHRLPHPVLSVGNLTFGGTGKTPLVRYLCEALLRRGRRPAILSRGYRADGDAGNDEARLLRRHLPGVPHVQDPDRHAGGTSVADRADVYVLDDGFQHLPLHRDADVVLIDATDPFGGGFCPPAGRLREPLAALGRADLVLITRVELADDASVGATMREIRARTRAPVATVAFRASCTEPLDGREVLVACAIGNPRAFVATVEALGAGVARTRFFRDHHAYTSDDVAALREAGLPVVVTEKDAVKLEPLWADGVPLHVVTLAVEPRDGGEEIERLLERL